MKTSVILRCAYEPCRSFNVARFHEPDDFEERTVIDPETGFESKVQMLKDPTLFRLWSNDCNYTTVLQIVEGFPKVISVPLTERGEMDVR